jgi:uncharacterized protein YbjQ (UPF0145 family)
MRPNPLLIAAVLLPLLCAAPAQARDTRLKLDAATALAAARAEGHLDGSVRFYFEGVATPAVLERFGDATTSRKTNAVGKSDEEACRWAFFGALKALEAAAKARGANAVVGIRSHYKGVVFSHPTQYECGAGGLMAGVALRGTYAKVAAD